MALSGWLFADLILGLLIVFLGAVSIRYLVPVETATAEDLAEGEGDFEARECVTAMDPVWVQVELTRVAPLDQIMAETERQIAQAVEAREDLGPDVVFPFALFFGRPDAGTPSGGRALEGTRRAAEMREQLLDAMPDRFPSTAYRDFYGPGDPGIVRVDMFPEVTVCR